MALYQRRLGSVSRRLLLAGEPARRLDVGLKKARRSPEPRLQNLPDRGRTGEMDEGGPRTPGKDAWRRLPWPATPKMCGPRSRNSSNLPYKRRRSRRAAWKPSSRAPQEPYAGKASRQTGSAAPPLYRIQRHARLSRRQVGGVGFASGRSTAAIGRLAGRSRFTP